MPIPDRHLWALIGFLLVTLICTFPVALELGTAVKDLGDPLLNSWIMAWEVHSLFDSDQASFFDTNIFFPQRNTLAYSEFLIPQLVIAAPLILWTGNPILAHNSVLLISLLATALGTYWLAFHITGRRSASFAAGLILAFCPFMFSHLAHVQILFAAGIPLTFLFLSRWLETGHTRDAVLIGLVYAIQVLANAYYAVYLTFFAGLFLLVQGIRRGLWSKRRFWLQVLIAGFIAGTLVGPFFARYFQLQQEMGFHRVLPPPTPPSSFLATPASNWLYGRLTEPFGHPEAYLFPGIVASGLALVGLAQWLRREGRGSTSAGTTSQIETTVWWRFQIVDGWIAIVATVVLLLAMGWAVDTRLGPLPLRIASLANPALLLVLLLAARTWMHRRWRQHSRPVGLPRSGWTYPLLLLGAGVLSLGTAPYLLLYRWIPGFSSLRAIPRIHVIFMFALAILAAQGMAHLLRQVSGANRRLLAIALPLLIVLEYFSAPLPMVAAPRASEFPAAHQWLAQQNEDLVFVAYPIRISNNILYVYYSTRHWRKMVNGFSGFIPPLFREVMAKGRFFPSPEAIGDLQDLGVDLVLVDTERFREKRRQRLQSTLGKSQDLEEIAVFDSTIVYRVKPRPSAAPQRTLPEIGLVPLDRADLSLRASFDVDSLSRAADGDRRTRWASPMRGNEWFEIEWRETAAVAALQLDISGVPHDYPRGYRVETSEDGNRWRSVAQAQEFHPPILDFLEPSDFVLRFEWQPHRARFLRFVQTGESTAHPWSVAELRVWIDPS